MIMFDTYQLSDLFLLLLKCNINNFSQFLKSELVFIVLLINY